MTILGRKKGFDQLSDFFFAVRDQFRRKFNSKCKVHLLSEPMVQVCKFLLESSIKACQFEETLPRLIVGKLASNTMPSAGTIRMKNGKNVLRVARSLWNDCWRYCN